MKVLIRYQQSFSTPATCCICGAANPTVPYETRSEARGFAWKGRVKLRFMKCKACVDEAKTMRRQLLFRTFSPEPGRSPGWGLGIGGVVGLLAGAGIMLAGFLSTGEFFSAGETNDVLNGVIGPALVCLSTPAVFGAVAGLGIQKAFSPRQRTSTDPNTRSFFLERLRTLQSPVVIVDFTFVEGFIGIKDPTLVLRFANETYGRLFARLNGGLLASYYCSKCGQEIDPDKYAGMVSGVCTDCGKLFCQSCLQAGWRKRCPDCNKPTRSATITDLAKKGIVRITQSI